MQVTALRAAMLAVAMLTPTITWAACCPSDGNTSPKAARGLGESTPTAPDLAADPAWRIYEFERDGVRYTQVNDNLGAVRAAVGRIGETAWVLPIGRDADRVLLPGDAVPAGNARVLLRSKEVEVVLIDNGTTQYWRVRALSATD
ncbi:MAG: hypothetical protein E6Q50_18160 [Lysobacter sp.]|nr:MAG: hypothetical protein E6Q50_18160 [Lysobacter sp.]